MGSAGQCQQGCRYHCSLLSFLALSWCLAHASNVNLQSSLAVQQAWPTRVTQFVRTPVTVTLNGSFCEQVGQAATAAGELQLVLQAASTDHRNITLRSSSVSSNCRSVEFQLQLNASAKAGTFTAHLVALEHRLSWQLPNKITVVVPPLLSMLAPAINVSADQNAFAVSVQLNQPAPAQGVMVWLQVVNDAHAVKMVQNSLTWSPGSSGVQSFWLSLQSVPSSGRLLLQLLQPYGGAVLDPSASATTVLVQSPVIGFKTNLGYYRGLNTSTPQVHFTVSGSSAFASEFIYFTYLLPDSVPSAAPCHPLAAACSVADLEAVSNITVTGTRWMAPGQQQLQPVDLPINWARLPPEAELRVAVRIVSRMNVRVAQQPGQVAAVVFGTPPGHCPPGSTLLPDDAGKRNSSHDGPAYTDVAALQDLALAIVPEPVPHGSSSNTSNTSSTASAAAAAAAAAAVGSSSRSLLQQGTAGCSSSSSNNCSAGSTALVNGSTDASAASTVIDLDPPFRPMVDRYIALLPPKAPGTGKLLLASSRWGDVVVVDASACQVLESARYQVSWPKHDRMWRQRYHLGGQRMPCWLRVHVFTRNDPSVTGGAAAAAAGDDNDSSSSSTDGSGSGSSANSSSKAASSSMWDLPADFVLYRSYTIRFIPLRPPEQLSLRAITFSNSATTIIACGVPRGLSHLFETAPPVRLSSVIRSMADKVGGSNSSTLAGGFAPAAAASSSTADSTAIEAGQYGGYGSYGSSVPRPLVPAPGQQVQLAYLVLMKPGAPPGSSSSSSSATEEQQQQQQQVPPAVASMSAAGSRSRQEQYSLHDPVSNKTIVWSRYTSVDCAQDHYILLPLAQMRPDMKMVPELLDPEAEGVKITMSQAALALQGSGLGAASGQDTNSSSSSYSSSNSTELYAHASTHEDTESNSRSLPGVNGSSKFKAAGISAAVAAAAVDGGKGFGGLGNKNLGDSVWCSSLYSKGTSAGAARSAFGSSSSNNLGGGAKSSSSNSSSGSDASSSSSDSDSNPCGFQLPGVTAELPVILTADEGMSSRTYTLLLYSNESTAAAVRNMVLPQEAAAAASAAKTAAAAGSSSDSTPQEDAARLSAAYFASRPKDWPLSPAQSSTCSVCPNGTYSTRIDAHECKVCPPGKYAASPFSTTCLFCPPGTFSYYWGAPTCRTCLPGTFAADAGSLFCTICKDGTTTYSEGATSCDVSVGDGGSVVDTQGASEYALLLSFGVVLDGTMLEAVTRSTTGINGSSEGIVAVLVRSDTASALNVSLGSVQVLAVQQISTRQLLVNVSATVPVDTEEGDAAAATQDLSADQLIQQLVDDPNTFLRTTQTLGAESASVQDLITQRTRRARLGYAGNLHVVLWPTLLGSLLLMAVLLYTLWRWKRGRRTLHFISSVGTGGPVGTASIFGDLSSTSAVHGGFSPSRGLPFRHHRHTNSSSSSNGSRSSGSETGIATGGGGLFAERLAGRTGALRRSWQQFWSSDVRVMLHDQPTGAAFSVRASSGRAVVLNELASSSTAKHNTGHAGASGTASTSSVGGGSSSGSSSPGSSRSAGSDELSITVSLGECADAGVPLSEESFTARLRAKQVNAQLGAAGVLSSRHPRGDGCWG